MSYRSLLLSLALLLPLAGCDRESSKPASASPTSPAADHDHGPGDTHTEHLPPQSLGSVTAGGFTYDLTHTSPFTPGKEVDIQLKQTAGTGTPKALRLWIGTESARGSVKAKAHNHPEGIDAHVTTPDPLPADARLWIEVETDQGRLTGSVEIKR